MPKTKTFYLAHNFHIRKQIRKWELKMEGKYNVQLDNPFYDNPKRAEEMVIIDKLKERSKEQREYLRTRSAYNIVEDDLEKIRKSDGIIAFAQNLRVGTAMEIFFAGRILRITVIVLTRRHKNHPWITQHAQTIVGNRRQLEKEIEKLCGRRK